MADDTLTAAAKHLSTHPWIAHADVRDGHVVITPHRTLFDTNPEPGALVTEHLRQWGEVYELTYEAASGWRSGEFDISGWRASDTGDPLPAEHMADWLARTVDLIAGLEPRHVLELGCGTGMLVHALAPRVRGYVATDVVDTAVSALSAAVPPHVRVVRAAAHEASAPQVGAALRDLGFPGGRPDCVVLNSVAQCFPSVDYLAAVVGQAIAAVSPGGHVVVGDNRHPALLDDYARWVERSRNPGITEDELTARAQERASRDEELLFDPLVLAEIAAGSGRDVRMSVRPKLMREDSELTRYRFDCVLRVDAPAPPPRTEPPTTTPCTTAAEIHAALAGHDAAVIMSPHDPHTLEVVAPAAAAWVPVTGLGPGAAHEPLWRFARQRLTAVARRHLRPVSVPLDVHLPTAGDAR